MSAAKVSPCAFVGSGAPQDRTYIACLVFNSIPAIISISYFPLSLVIHMFNMLAIITHAGLFFLCRPSLILSIK